MADDKKMRELSDDELESAAGGIYQTFDGYWIATYNGGTYARYFKTKEEAQAFLKSDLGKQYYH